VLDQTGFYFPEVLPPVRRPDNYPGATDGGSHVPAFSTALHREGLMKYCSLTRKYRACPPRTPFGVLCHLPTTHPSSAQQPTPHPIHSGSAPPPYLYVRTNSLRLLPNLAEGPLNVIQNP